MKTREEREQRKLNIKTVSMLLISKEKYLTAGEGI